MQPQKLTVRMYYDSSYRETYPFNKAYGNLLHCFMKYRLSVSEFSNMKGTEVVQFNTRAEDKSKLKSTLDGIIIREKLPFKEIGFLDDKGENIISLGAEPEKTEPLTSQPQNPETLNQTNLKNK